MIIRTRDVEVLKNSIYKYMKRFKKLHCPKKMLFSANINAKTVKILRNKEISRTFEKILKSKILKLCKHFSYNKQTYIYRCCHQWCLRKMSMHMFINIDVLMLVDLI